MVSVCQGYTCLAYEEIDSTNSEARRLNESGQLQGPTWLFAQSQTAGRGRQGRVWESSSKNLFCSLALYSDKSAAELAQLSFVAAVSVREAIECAVPQSSPKLKWPNDVLLEGGKVSGILLESFPSGRPNETCLVIGIGVNLASHPHDTPYPATSLSATTGQLIAPEQMLLTLSERFDASYARWLKAGFAPIREDWLAHAWNWGKTVRVRLPKEELSGTFADIDAEGALILHLPNGAIRTITAGDVFFDTAAE